jgi:predicted ester cyclase
MRDGRMVYSEIYETAEQARAALRSRASPLSLPEQLQERYVRAFNERDWAALEELLPEDLVQVDRRVMATEVGQGREAAMFTLRSAVEAAPDAKLSSRTLAVSDDAIAAIITFTGSTPDGGAAEVSMGYLGVLRDGHAHHNEYLEPDDEAAIVARYEEWLAHLRQARHFSEVMAAHDWGRLHELYDDAFSQTDYREVNAPAIVGGQTYADHLQETFAPVSDLRAIVDVIEVDGDRRVGRIVYRGRNQEIEGVEFEVVFWTVTTIDGMRILQSDVYGSQEEARAALASGSFAVPRSTRRAGSRTPGRASTS